MTPPRPRRGRLLALAALAIGLWWARGALLPAEPDSGIALTDPARSRAVAGRGAARPGQAVAATSTADGVLPRRALLDADSRVNPFAAPRAAVPAAKPAPVMAEFVGPLLPPPPPPPPPPPRLPYRFVGALHEKGQPPSVYLSLGDKLIQARAGDTLEGGYRLDKIAPRELTFMNLQQNLTVLMPVDGEPS